jgi:hypothetical protein
MLLYYKARWRVRDRVGAVVSHSPPPHALVVQAARAIHPTSSSYVGMEAGAVPFAIVVMRLSTPGLPCERVLAVVREGCWGHLRLCLLTHSDK